MGKIYPKRPFKGSQIDYLRSGKGDKGYGNSRAPKANYERIRANL